MESQQDRTCPHGLSAEQEERVTRRLDTVDLATRYDCIIHAETLHQDWTGCMRRYAATSAQPLPEPAKARSGPGAGSSELHARPSPRRECSYYYDADTERFVWQLEKRMAGRMGYSSCCGPPTTDHWPLGPESLVGYPGSCSTP